MNIKRCVMEFSDGRPVVNIVHRMVDTKLEQKREKHHKVKKAKKKKKKCNAKKKKKFKRGPGFNIKSCPKCRPKKEIPYKRPCRKYRKQELPKCPPKEPCDKFSGPDPDIVAPFKIVMDKDYKSQFPPVALSKVYKPKFKFKKKAVPVVQYSFKEPIEVINVNEKLEPKPEDLPVEPMKLKFPFWLRNSKTVNLDDKMLYQKNEEVILKAQRPQPTLYNPAKINHKVVFQEETLVKHENPMKLKPNFWSKASTVFVGPPKDTDPPTDTVVKVSGKKVLVKPQGAKKPIDYLKKEQKIPMKLKQQYWKVPDLSNGDN